jgi:hypothetical protein
MNGDQVRDRVGDILEDLGAVTEEQLEAAVELQQAGDGRPLGELLVALGFVSAVDVELALIRQQARRGSLTHQDGIRCLDEAHKSAKRAGSYFDELAAAATELGKRGPR